jgi:hypothetical protein
VDEPGGRPGQATLAATTRHASDKYSVVRVTVHHANPIAQDRATGNRARWIDRKDGHAATRRPHVPEERGHQRALPGSGWSRHADDMSPPRQRKEGIKRLQPARVFVFDQCRQAWQRALVRSLEATKHLGGSHHDGDGRGALSRM